ncbi:MAG: hypothetical protein HY579_01660 [Nitrospinae bacterium]|nr:hypothetical protein [Nitrospinota bacterium]
MRNNRFALFLMLVAFALAFMVPVHPLYSAETDGGDIVYEDTGKKPPVVFSHQKHKEAKNKCEDCHDKIFQKKKGAADAGGKMDMDALKEGKYCGACHDDEKAFTARKNCKKCHVAP